MLTLTALPIMTDAQAEKLFKTFLNRNQHVRTLITEDADVYTGNGKMLAKFRKNVVDLDVLKPGLKPLKAQ
jgi:hypothetical protein